jgi:hypothetical protein
MNLMVQWFKRFSRCTSHYFLPAARLCRNTTNHLDVMLSESEASAFPNGLRKADSSAEFILSQTKALIYDILTQPRDAGEDQAGG